MPGAADDWQYHPWLRQNMRSAKRRVWVGWVQHHPIMPTTPKLFSILPNVAGPLSGASERPVGSWLGLMLAALADKLAPDGFEDDQGFHRQEGYPRGGRRLTVEPNCLGEHI